MYIKILKKDAGMKTFAYDFYVKCILLNCEGDSNGHRE